MPVDGPPLVVKYPGPMPLVSFATAPEIDPNGKSAHEPGAKLDHGKVDMALVLGGFCRALRAVAEIGTFGARKYTDNGWLTVPNGHRRYSSALLRHYFEEAEGEELDQDSQLYHDAHTAWNALARLELRLRGRRD